MSSSEMIAELAARLRRLADGISTDCSEDPREESRNVLRKAAMELEQGVVKSHSHDDSYVLVLLDAHGHPVEYDDFNDDIFYRSTDQSYPALDRDNPFNIKKRLHEAIRKHLIDASSAATPHTNTQERSVKVSSAATLGTSRIVVRVYANTTKLENDLLRPLQQFAVQFSSMDSDFDFLCVRDEAMVELKVVDAFQAARKDPDCKHVFLAAWNRPGYISMLQTHSENVTLIQGYGMGAGAKFISLTCAVISIPEVFSKPLEQDLFVSLTSRSAEKHIITAIVSDKDYMWRIGKDVKPCRSFHLANGCRFGDDCCYGHSDISPQVLEAFRYTVKRMPCSKGSHCPLDHCIYGHVCQKPNCITDDPTSCSMRKFHGVDLAFASWKKGKHAPKFPTGGPVQSREKDVDEASATSFWF
ncbi:hypothetical protein CC77DRAFT_1069910 [Alternaria alternata]|uniref:C3H1-type domain-containing protein n=1 Tax=Alternaria alternata TaxID=5599 RepID=A0A177DL16_ALTAL|nr:hypothetical protein CC77DRAFT_1069910 [Alternaria alternata]OAG20503.1 hypothetical protein CC77DRAFT_1069910 [Alternaria alternata]